MAQNATSSIQAFLEAAAGKQPTPGGGAVSALCGALAASMGEMVMAYSVNRKGSAEFDVELTVVMKELKRARALLIQLMVEDQDAYASYAEAKQSKDAGRLVAATLLCIRVPQAIAAVSIGVLDLADRVVEKSNKWLLSDLAVCCELAMSSIRASHHNVRVNLSGVTAEERVDIEAQVVSVETRGVELVKRIIPRIRAVIAT
jgi:methenyltetrahydrofolate cyclohydrolase